MTVWTDQPAEPVGVLLEAAARQDQGAWRALVRRYQPLVTSVARRFRLSVTDAEDVSQTVWLRLFENLGSVRDPAALPGWLTTTTQRQAIRLLNRAGRSVCVEHIDVVAESARSAPEPVPVDHDLLSRERTETVRAGLDELTSRQRDLLLLAAAEPPLPYAEIAVKMNMPVGSIGPTRARSLKRLRQTTAIRDYAGSAPALSA